MKQTRNSLILFLLTILAFNPESFASHFASAEIQATYIGTGPTDLKYRVELILYKACEPNNVDLYEREFIRISSVSAGFNFLDTATSPASDTVDQLCPAFSNLNSCRNATSIYPGFVKRVYTREITVPQRSTDLVFSWTSGSRNGGILNLQNANGLNIYVACGLNNLWLAYQNNSTPRYTVAPIPYLCVNQPAHFYNYPVDPDNDSLYTINKVPNLSDATSFASYINGYSPANPVASITPYLVDPITGETNFVIPSTGKYVVAFKTTQYDRASGQEIGFVMRDVQISVLSCNAAPPVFHPNPLNVTGGVVSNPDQISVNAGSALSFDIKAGTPFGTDLAGYVQSTLPSGANVQITKPSADSVKFHFTWTPATSDTGTVQVVYKAADTSCNIIQPVNLNAYHSVNIRVNKSLGISSFNNYSKVKLHPIPARDLLHFEPGLQSTELAEVYNMTGQKVRIFTDPGHTINISGLIPGYYTLKLISKQGVSSGSFIKE